MLTYEQLDWIADAYIPLLFIVSFILLAKVWRSEGRESRVHKSAALFLSIVWVFFLMSMDNWLGLWASVGLDYSTHTALSIALVVFIGAYGKSWAWGTGISLLAYFGLMYYQAYHSVMDMVTTGVVILPVVFWVHWKLTPPQSPPDP